MPGEVTRFADQGGVSCINIFQSGNAIVSDIHSAYALTHGSESAEHTLRVVSTFSVEGGSGKTTICYALAAAAARDHQQVLFLDLEPAAYIGQLYQQEENRYMDDLLYAIRDERDIAKALLNTCYRNKDGVMVLPPFHSEKDRRSLKKNHFRTFISAIEESTDFSYLFVNLPADLQDMTLWMLEESSVIVQTYSDSPAGRYRMGVMGHCFENLDEQIPAKILTVLNRCSGREEEAGIDVKFPTSESLRRGDLVGEVQDKNPEYMRACTNLLRLIG